MANSRASEETYEYVTVNTAPDSTGYWTNPVSPRSKAGVRKLYFSIRGTGTMTPTLQFKCAGDTDWTDFVTDITMEAGVRLLLDDVGPNVAWRAGVAVAADYSSGACSFGFDW